MQHEDGAEYLVNGRCAVCFCEVSPFDCQDHLRSSRHLEALRRNQAVTTHVSAIVANARTAGVQLRHTTPPPPSPQPLSGVAACSRPAIGHSSAAQQQCNEADDDDDGAEFIIHDMCTLCNSTIANWKVRETHLAGSKHRAAVARRRATTARGERPFGTAIPSTNGAVSTAACTAPFRHNSEPTSRPAPPLDDLGASYIIDGLCTLCGANIDNWKVRETHLAGAKHRSRLATVRANNGLNHTSTKVVSCPHCKKVVTEMTSHTEKNPGRKFYSCKDCPSGKKFWSWADELGTEKDSSVEGIRAKVPVSVTCKAPMPQINDNTATSTHFTNNNNSEHIPIRMTLSPAQRDGALIARAIVEFYPPHPVIISVLKQLHPRQRSFSVVAKAWFVNAEVLQQFVSELAVDSDVESCQYDEDALGALRNRLMAAATSAPSSPSVLPAASAALAFASGPTPSSSSLWLHHGFTTDCEPNTTGNTSVSSSASTSSCCSDAGGGEKQRTGGKTSKKKEKKAKTKKEPPPPHHTAKTSRRTKAATTSSKSSKTRTSHDDEDDDNDRCSSDPDCSPPAETEDDTTSTNSSRGCYQTTTNRFQNYYCPPVIEEEEDCGCGRPHETVHGQHVCRFYGTFECFHCSSTWSSAYVWRDQNVFEKQDCRRCGRANEPKEFRPRERRPPPLVNGNAPHDERRCHMCRRLGHRCTDAY